MISSGLRKAGPVVDVHAHYVSSDLLAEVARNGAYYGVELHERPGGERRLVLAGTPLRAVSAALSDLKQRSALLQAGGIDRQILSTWTDLCGEELPRDEAARWSRLQNETLAAAADSMPEQFSAMGTLPMQHPALALAELEYIVRDLGMRSVEICTSVNGRDLDHGDFESLWKRLCDLEVLVLLHPPHRPVGLERLGDYFLNNLIGYPTDTTIAAARLIFSGILRDLPGLKICLAHGGGFLPYQIGRLDRGFTAHPACRMRLHEPPSDFLSCFYYDTLTHSTPALDYLARTVGPGRLLFGSDYPFEMLDEAGPARIGTVDGLGANDRDAILGGNALALIAASGAR